MPPRRHVASSSTSSASFTLPSRFTVPPMPPKIHRRLVMEVREHGVLLRPKPSDDESTAWDARSEGVLISWGVRGKVEVLQGGSLGDGDEGGVELGGVLGIVRLWDAAYLLVFLPTSKPPSPLFSNHIDPDLGEDDEALGHEATANSHEVYTLTDIHAVPLVPDLARRVIEEFERLQSSRRPNKVPAALSKSGKLKWSLFVPKLTISGAGAVPSEENRSVADDSYASSDTDAASLDQRSAAGSYASRDSLFPEADESTSIEAVDPYRQSAETQSKKKFSVGWGRFMPKVRDPQRAKTEGTSAAIRRPSRMTQASKLLSEAALSGNVPEVLVKLRRGQKASEDPAGGSAGPHPATIDPPQRRELETKIIRQIIREFSSGGFFYSFDFDLTHSLQHKRRLLTSRLSSGNALVNLFSDEKGISQTFPPCPSESPVPSHSARDAKVKPENWCETDSSLEDDFVEPNVRIPLWRRVDRRFFWNEWLLKDFLDLGLHAYVVPVTQGWVQSSAFSVPIPPNPLDPSISLGAVPVDLVLISRRSRDRAGLRYQRRGIDDEGHVANMVETEMIVRAKVEGKVSLFSFVQVRGSIPLKWSQSPYSMKPPPVLDQPVEQSVSVANIHFKDLTTRYGPITIINLSEQTGKEGLVTNGYRELAQSLARPDVVYKSFDFHAKCRGMKWENISELVEDFDVNTMGYLWTLQGEVIREQAGAFRTNCIDCLDRTNVVQSALARHVLSAMLTQLGLILDPATSAVESVFNNAWANNGDMLSFCYAHTSALKGDFVRTGKRDLSGMLHDGVSSISRMFYGAISDFFAQSVISFFLGHRNLGVFSEFLENLQSSEESNLVKLSRVRAAAVETSSARVLTEGEQRISGWTLLSPVGRNVKLSPKLEEKVLILTKPAIYVVSFNYSLEKVIGFTRIPLASITSLQKGAYILSTLQEAGRDSAENSGFLINFSPMNESSRYSTYSLRNKTPSSPSPSAVAGTPTAEIGHAEVDPLASGYFAFKVMPREFVARGGSTLVDDSDDEVDTEAETSESCRSVAERIVNRIGDQCERQRVGLPDGFIVNKDIVSLTEAQQSTSLLARMDYAVKRFLWL